MDNSDGRLSSSEKRTIEQIAAGDYHVSEMDWVALQRLKRLGLAEEQDTGAALTEDGRRVFQDLLSGP